MNDIIKLIEDCQSFTDNEARLQAIKELEILLNTWADSGNLPTVNLYITGCIISIINQINVLERAQLCTQITNTLTKLADVDINLLKSGFRIISSVIKADQGDTFESICQPLLVSYVENIDKLEQNQQQINKLFIITFFLKALHEEIIINIVDDDDNVRRVAVVVKDKLRNYFNEQFATIFLNLFKFIANEHFDICNSTFFEFAVTVLQLFATMANWIPKSCIVLSEIWACLKHLLVNFDNTTILTLTLDCIAAVSHRSMSNIERAEILYKQNVAQLIFARLQKNNDLTLFKNICSTSNRIIIDLVNKNDLTVNLELSCFMSLLFLALELYNTQSELCWLASIELQPTIKKTFRLAKRGVLPLSTVHQLLGVIIRSDVFKIIQLNDKSYNHLAKTAFKDSNLTTFDEFDICDQQSLSYILTTTTTLPKAISLALYFPELTEDLMRLCFTTLSQLDEQSSTKTQQVRFLLTIISCIIIAIKSLDIPYTIAPTSSSLANSPNFCKPVDYITDQPTKNIQLSTFPSMIIPQNYLPRLAELTIKLVSVASNFSDTVSLVMLNMLFQQLLIYVYSISKGKRTHFFIELDKLLQDCIKVDAIAEFCFNFLRLPPSDNVNYNYSAEFVKTIKIIITSEKLSPYLRDQLSLYILTNIKLTKVDSSTDFYNFYDNESLTKPKLSELLNTHITIKSPNYHNYAKIENAFFISLNDQIQLLGSCNVTTDSLKEILTTLTNYLIIAKTSNDKYSIDYWLRLSMVVNSIFQKCHMAADASNFLEDFYKSLTQFISDSRNCNNLPITLFRELLNIEKIIIELCKNNNSFDRFNSEVINNMKLAHCLLNEFSPSSMSTQFDDDDDLNYLLPKTMNIINSHITYSLEHLKLHEAHIFEIIHLLLTQKNFINYCANENTTQQLAHSQSLLLLELLKKSPASFILFSILLNQHNRNNDQTNIKYNEFTSFLIFKEYFKNTNFNLLQLIQFLEASVEIINEISNFCTSSTLALNIKGYTSDITDPEYLVAEFFSIYCNSDLYVVSLFKQAENLINEKTSNNLISNLAVIIQKFLCVSQEIINNPPKVITSQPNRFIENATSNASRIVEFLNTVSQTTLTYNTLKELIKHLQ